MANFLLATFCDRLQAEAAYTALESADFPLEQVSLVGKGYKLLDELKLFDPNLAARQQVKRMVTWLLPFGLFAGFTFNQVTGLTIAPALSPLLNGLLGGLMGAVSGAMGGFIVSGGFGILSPGIEGAPFEQRLQQGKYLLVVNGVDPLIQRGYRVLRPLNSEALQIINNQQTGY
jgi:hypothetical protein